jgi:hypothetical protein
MATVTQPMAQAYRWIAANWLAANGESGREMYIAMRRVDDAGRGSIGILRVFESSWFAFVLRTPSNADQLFVFRVSALVFTV